MIIYDKKVNSFCRKYLISNSSLSKEEFQNFSVHLKEIESFLFEAMLLFKGVSFEVYGENIPLALMLNIFGTRQIEELIEQKAISFVLNKAVITYTLDDIPGLNPLQFGELNSGPHSDPEQSIELGFSWMKNKPKRSTRRMLTRKIIPLYQDSSEISLPQSIELAYDAYNINELEALGLPYRGEIGSMSLIERRAICQVAHDIWETATLASRGYSTFENHRFFRLTGAMILKLKQANAIKESTAKIFEIEGLPNLKELLTQNPILIDKTSSIRIKNNSIQFRKWIEETSKSTSALEISGAYIDSLVQKNGYFQKTKGKLVRSLGVGAVGAGLGFALNPEAGVAAGLALGLLDTFLLEKFIGGWHPRMFIENIKEVADVQSFSRN